MAILDASGTVDGTSSASASAAVGKFVAAALGGEGTLAPLGGVAQLSSARFDGDSSFQWEYVLDASALVSATSDASVSTVVVHNASASFLGSSEFRDGAPLVSQGTSTFSVLPVVERQLPPIRAITMGPKTFRWLQPLQRGDLSVFLTDRRTPVAPWRITYRLAQLRLNGTRKYVGPQHRVPVAGDLGEFYVTGRAGETGQPGLWVIEWLFQQTCASAVQTAEMPFQVLDAVLVNDPRDLLDRKIKFGWS